MYRELYAAAGRWAHYFATPFLYIYTHGTYRVRVLVVNDHAEVLLVRSWFGHQRWSLPGGGILRGETAAVAAVRETFEETGVRLEERFCLQLGEFSNGDSNAPFTVSCYVAHIRKQPIRIAKKHRLEILEAAWFPLDHLPELRSETVDRALRLLDAYESG